MDWKLCFPYLTKEQIQQIECYHQELLLFKNLFLTKKQPEKEVIRLIKDGIISSCLLIPHFRLGRVMDVGSGAGFPGILLAILSPSQQSFIFVEPSLKKVEFLNHCVDLLGLRHKITIQASLFHPTKEKILTFKGFAPLKKTLNLVSKNLLDGGVSYHFKNMSYQTELQELSKKERELWDIRVLESYLFEQQKRFVLVARFNVPRGTIA